MGCIGIMMTDHKQLRKIIKELNYIADQMEFHGLLYESGYLDIITDNESIEDYREFGEIRYKASPSGITIEANLRLKYHKGD